MKLPGSVVIISQYFGLEEKSAVINVLNHLNIVDYDYEVVTLFGL